MKSLFKFVKRVINWVLRCLRSMRIFSVLQITALRFIARFPFLTSLYYNFGGDYHLEQRGDLLGRIDRLEGTHTERGTLFYQLVRNVHSLERGLSVKEGRRPVFAEGYILSTVIALGKVIRYQDAEQAIARKNTIAWAFDVINKYFQVTEKTPKIQSAEEIFQGLLISTKYKPGSKFPHPRAAIDRSPVSYEALRELALQRRSIRWYQPRPVPRDELDRAIEIATLSPSACNRQPFQFVVLDESNLVQQVSEIAVGLNGFSPVIPVIVVLVSKSRAYFEHERHLLYIDGALAAMSFMYALETMGLSSCPINWPDIKISHSKLAKLLGLAPDERVIMLVTVGYADSESMIAYSQRNSLDMARKYNLT